jgi:predicted ferric reductase
MVQTVGSYSAASADASQRDDAKAPGGRPGWKRDLTGSLIWASLLVVVALWVSHGGVQDLGGARSDALVSLGRLSGLLASDLMLIQVLLIARIPWLERAWGQDRLLGWHRVVGFVSVNGMVLHIVLVTVGYSMAGDSTAVSEFVSMVLDYPGMLLALAGTLLLIMVAVLSIRRARRRLRYESWHLLHLYAYLGTGLALPHQLWTGGDFLASPAATLYWWSLWGTTLVCVLVWRVGLPLFRTLRHRLVVELVSPEAPGVVSVYLTGRRLDRLPVRAGQFFVWRFLDGPGWSRGHPYSLSGAPDGKSLRITVQDVGDGSSRVTRMAPGTRVVVEGPYGLLHAGVRTRRKVTLMGAGIGMAPMLALMEDLDHDPGELTVIYRVGDLSQAALLAHVERTAERKGSRVHVIAGHRIRDRNSWLPESAAHLTDVQALQQLVPDIGEHDVFLCGGPGWMAAARRAALKAGVPARAVHRERFSW